MPRKKKSASRYAYWQRSLAKDFSGWDAADSPFPGFWRVRAGKNGLWEGVATFDHGDTVVAIRGRDSKPVDVLSIWMNCAFNPVTEEQYRHYMAHGNWWDSLTASDPATHGQFVSDVALAEPIGPPARRGHQHETR